MALMNWHVIFYADNKGNEPVKDFILKQPDGAIAEILHVLKLLREFNVGLRMPYVTSTNPCLDEYTVYGISFR